MKKFFLLATVACLTMASCEDVPAPYELFDPNGDNGNGNGESETIVASGDGTAESPFNVMGVIEYIQGLEPNVNSEQSVYIKGVASQIKEISTSFNNCTFYISDNGTTTNQFYVYRCKGINGGNVTSETLVEVGDTVVIYGKVVNYSGNTPETVQKEAYIVSIAKKNGSIEGGTDPGTPDTPDVPTTGAGSKAEPYNVASAQAASGNAWVKGYIVGFVDGQTYATGAKFEVPAQAETEILIADAADCTDPAKCMPIQLPAGDIRTALELFANPSLLKQEVQLFGSIEKYFGVTGLKSTSCAILGDKVIGKDPEDTTPDTPAEGATGTGTAADPFNVAGVLNYTKALAADVNSSEAIYFKGKVSTVKEISTKDAYNNATFYISDDGTATNEFYIFRCLGLNKADIESADLVKVGDEVVMCGKVVNYKGNTPETVQKDAYIVSINGEGGSVNPGDNPGTDPNPGTNPDAGDYVTFDMSANFFNIPTENQTEAGTYTCGDYSITLTPAGTGNFFKYNDISKYVILGKQGATLEFGAFDFAVEKIEITGRAGASASTKQNIYVGETAVSTQTIGVTGTNTYVIAEGSRAAGTKYVLKVESAHNTQFTTIKIYKAQ